MNDRMRLKRVAKKKRRETARNWARIKAKRQRRAEDFGIKTGGVTVTHRSPEMALRSLRDLLPDGARIEQTPEGKFIINLDSRRGDEAKLLEDVAKRLNIGLEHVELTSVDGVPVEDE